MKVCIICNIEKEYKDFYKRKDSKDGYRNDCKVCRNLKDKPSIKIVLLPEERDAYKKKYHKNFYLENKEKILNQCKEYRDNNKDVILEKSRNYYNDNKEKYKNWHKEYYDNNKETILEKDKEYYNDNKEIILEKCKEYRDNNKEKISEYHKEYRMENKEKISNYHKEYGEKNKEKISNYRKEYRILNKDKINTKNTEYVKNRYKNDYLYKLKHNTKTMIKAAFNNKNLKKPEKTEEILGISINEFKLYLESKFETWMTWENRGMYNGELNYGWDIDHIIPLASVDTEDGIIKLNHYTNLQPLCSYTNRHIKRDKLYYYENSQ